MEKLELDNDKTISITKPLKNSKIPDEKYVFPFS